MEERPMRRKDREISEPEARQLLAQGEYGVLSTVSPDGAPYGVPLSYVYHQGEIFFHSAPEGRKVEYLAAGARASFCVVGATELLPEKFSTRYESAIASGRDPRARMATRRGRRSARLVEKYAPEFRPQGEEYIARAEDTTRVFALCVRHLTGKRRR